jgi:predicted RNA-binding protein with PUA-like domain
MAYWLLKTEAASYGWDDLMRDGGTEWDGVRNAQAAANLKAMRPGDRAILYHSVDQKRAVGTVRIARAAEPEAGQDGPWVSVRVEPEAALEAPVTLAAMKADPRLAGLAMIRQSRLSVSPVTDAEWAAILDMGRG